jgi:hypothetical protein
MRIELQSIRDKGVLQRERLILKVVGTTDIGKYVLLQTGYYEDSVTTTVHKAFWFPDKRVHSGDLIVVYTKPGRESDKALENGTTSHFFYWGLNKPIWEEEGTACVLLYAPQWDGKSPEELGDKQKD